MRQYIDTLQDVQGNALVGATVTVSNYIGGALASIFSDNGLTPIANSTVTTGSDGQFSFFAADGDYSLALAKSGSVYKTQAPVSMFDGTPQLTFADTGTANAYTTSNSALEKALRTGLRTSFLAANTSTGASTFSYNGLAAKPIVFPDYTACSQGTITANGIYSIEYDGTSWQIRNGVTNPPLYAQTAAELAASVTPSNEQIAPGNILRYGTNTTPGTTDMTAAFTAALAQAAQGGTSTFLPNGTYKISSGLTWDTTKSSITGDNAILTSSISSGPWITATSTLGQPNSNRNRLQGITFSGTSTSGVQALYLVGTVGDQNTFVNVRDCTFVLFDNAVLFGTYAYETEFSSCNWSSCGPTAAVYYPLAATGGGERISFSQCAFYNGTGPQLYSTYPSCQYFLQGCSIDYCTQDIYMSAGYCFATGCYFENNNDTAYWFQTGTGSATISIVNSAVIQTGAKTSYNIGYSASGSNGGIFLNRCKLYSNTNTVMTPLIGGTGTAYGQNNSIDGFANIAYAWSTFSTSANQTDNGTFSNGTTGWNPTATSGTAPTASSNTLIFTPSVNSVILKAYWSIAAQPGDNVGFTCSIKCNTPSACSFNLQIVPTGADGAAISNAGVIGGYNYWDGSTYQLPTSYTTFRVTLPNLPAGTATAQIQLYTGTVNTTCTIDVQNVVITKY